MKSPRLAAVITGLCVGLCTVPAGNAPPADMRTVPASDDHFRYGGRFDFRNPASPVVIWEASTIAIDFEGDRAAARFSGVTDQAYFDASLDGVTTVLALRKGFPGGGLPLPVTSSGLHHLVLFKRSEATAGTVHFDGIDVAPDARVFSPPAPGYRLRMEFIGDSITVGACDEDGPVDQWRDRSTHDAAFSWAALTAAYFSADYRNISISGIGLAAGYTDIVMGQVWDRTYPSETSPVADPGGWKPDIVLVLLGDNDDSYPREHSLPFPPNFKEMYASLVHSIRSENPGASIVLLNGAMWAGIHSKELQAAWNAVVADLEARDSGISHYTFAHWTMNHPRVADHRALARELEAWLKSRPSMAGGDPIKG